MKLFGTTIGHCFIPRRTKDKRWLTFRNKNKSLLALRRNQIMMS
jgi:hypothetical protein